MKYLFLLLVGLAFLAVLLAVLNYSMRKPSTMEIVSQGPTVERLARLAHLVTTRVYIADVLTGEGEGYHGAWLIKGDALIGVDLRGAAITEKDLSSRRATISLPLPEILQSRVDHERTRTWEVRKTTWVPWGGDPDFLRDRVMRQGQRLVATAAGSPENLAHARLAAEAIIRSFYEEIGWQVKIVWRAGSTCQSARKRPVLAAATEPPSAFVPVLPPHRLPQDARPSPRP